LIEKSNGKALDRTILGKAACSHVKKLVDAYKDDD
jgi:hypothetical protein